MLGTRETCPAIPEKYDSFKHDTLVPMLICLLQQLLASAISVLVQFKLHIRQLLLQPSIPPVTNMQTATEAAY